MAHFEPKIKIKKLEGHVQHPVQTPSRWEGHPISTPTLHGASGSSNLAPSALDPFTKSQRCHRYGASCEFINSEGIARGVATGWTGVDMSTPLLPEDVPEIDANPVSFYLGGGGWCITITCRGSALDPTQTGPDPIIGSHSVRSPYVSTPHFLTWRRPWFPKRGYK